MRGAVLGLVPAIAVVLAMSAPPASGQTAQSLGQVPSLLKTPEAKGAFAQQIEGAPTPDQLGTHLPAILSAKAITTLLLPPTDTAPLNAVGAKPLPGQTDRYVAIVCTGGDVPSGAGDDPCRQLRPDETTPPLQVYVGLIEAKPGAAPALVAKPAKVDGMVNWRNTNLPSAPEALGDATGDTIRPDNFSGFDLAPYQISPDQRAFGLRGSWLDGYSGGMASYTALYMFAVIDGALRQVLTVAMSSYQDLAGDWHKDGTRSHDITQDANLLIVTDHKTNGHFDLLLKSRLGRWRQIYRWSTTDGNYQPAKG